MELGLLPLVSVMLLHRRFGSDQGQAGVPSVADEEINDEIEQGGCALRDRCAGHADGCSGPVREHTELA
jgi:hypothetical protein